MFFSASLLISFSMVVAAVPTRRGAGSVIWDGRLKEDFKLTDLDSSTASPFDSKNVLGAGQRWSEQILFPRVTPSKFDKAGSKALEVTINDESIFAPGGNAQHGFRRSELIPSRNNGTDATVQGVTTFHFSIQEDRERPLNYSHPYENVFIETSDYSSHVWTLKMGTPFDTVIPEADKKKLRLMGSTAGGKTEELLFEVLFCAGWHNFAIRTDWVQNTINVYYSQGYGELKEVVKTKPNDAKGKGQAHVGILKLPTPPAKDVAHEGYQPSNINEGLIYGGIFIENTPTPGDVSLCAKY